MIEIYWIYDYYLSSLYDKNQNKLKHLITEKLVDKIQLRVKILNKEQSYEWCKKITNFIKNIDSSLPIVVNDYPKIAEKLQLEEVHLGEKDFKIQEFSSSLKIGYTCHSLKDIIFALENNFHYIGVGCLFKSKTRRNLKAQGLDILRKASALFPNSIYPIGGINKKNFRPIYQMGTKKCALASFLFSEDYLNNALSLKYFKLEDKS